MLNSQDKVDDSFWIASFCFNIHLKNFSALTFAFMQFEDIIGQQQAKKRLTELVQHNRLSHALLFIGKEGAGALPLSIALSQYVVCEKVSGHSAVAGKSGEPALFAEEPDSTVSPRLPPEDACGVCAACIKSRQLIHPDIHFAYPVVTKKSGSPPVSTDYISEWREFIKSYPYGNVYDWLQFIGAENKQGNITANECNDKIHLPPSHLPRC